MKKLSATSIAKSLAALALATSAGASFGASTWSFGTNSGNCSAAAVVAGTCAAQAGSDAGAPALTGSAYSSTGNGSTFAVATLASFAGGFGVTAAGEDPESPQHATDNNGSTDLIMFNFGAFAFDMDSVKIGFKSNDADISVFRYTGAAAPTLAGVALTGMTAAGWQLVGNYANLDENISRSVNTTNQTSSWWLISAYNSSYGTTTADGVAVTSGGLIGNNNDYFKLLSIAGTATPTTKVPEPGSLALLGLGLVGLVASRRRKLASV